MKKLLLATLVLSLIIPQVTFAAWWNPFTWKIFNRVDTKTEVLEQRIKELEDKLSTPSSVATSTTELITKEEIIVESSNSSSRNKDQTDIDAKIQQNAILKAQQKIRAQELEAQEMRLRIEAQLKADAQAKINDKSTTTPEKNTTIINYATTTIIQYTYQTPPTSTTPAMQPVAPIVNQPIVSEACKAAISNYEDVLYYQTAQNYPVINYLSQNYWKDPLSIDVEAGWPDGRSYLFTHAELEDKNNLIAQRAIADTKTKEPFASTIASQNQRIAERKAIMDAACI